MLTYDNQPRENWWAMPLKILAGACLIVLAAAFFYYRPLLDRPLSPRSKSVGALVLWAVWMLSFRQDVEIKSWFGAVFSQCIAIMALGGLALFGFTHGVWVNFLILPLLVWLHVQLTKRWSARPNDWW